MFEFLRNFAYGCGWMRCRRRHTKAVGKERRTRTYSQAMASVKEAERRDKHASDRVTKSLANGGMRVVEQIGQSKHVQVR